VKGQAVEEFSHWKGIGQRPGRHMSLESVAILAADTNPNGRDVEAQRRTFEDR